MFADIEQIRTEINDEIDEIIDGKDRSESIKRYIGKKNQTPAEVESLIKYFLTKVKDKVNDKLTNYLYNEARVLKDTIDRVDGHDCDDDD
jgi:hypothetical protein